MMCRPLLFPFNSDCYFCSYLFVAESNNDSGHNISINMSPFQLGICFAVYGIVHTKDPLIHTGNIAGFGFYLNQ